MSHADRDEAKRVVSAAGWDEGAECEHCEGTGKAPGGRRLVHSMLGGLGADHEVEWVNVAIDRADRVEWVNGPLGHDLALTVDGRTYYYQVARPGAPVDGEHG